MKRVLLLLLTAVLLILALASCQQAGDNTPNETSANETGKQTDSGKTENTTAPAGTEKKEPQGKAP